MRRVLAVLGDLFFAAGGLVAVVVVALMAFGQLFSLFAEFGTRYPCECPEVEIRWETVDWIGENAGLEVRAYLPDSTEPYSPVPGSEFGIVAETQVPIDAELREMVTDRLIELAGATMVDTPPDQSGGFLQLGSSIVHVDDIISVYDRDAQSATRTGEVLASRLGEAEVVRRPTDPVEWYGAAFFAVASPAWFWMRLSRWLRRKRARGGLSGVPVTVAPVRQRWLVAASAGVVNLVGLVAAWGFLVDYIGSCSPFPNRCEGYPAVWPLLGAYALAVVAGLVPSFVTALLVSRRKTSIPTQHLRTHLVAAYLVYLGVSSYIGVLGVVTGTMFLRIGWYLYIGTYAIGPPLAALIAIRPTRPHHQDSHPAEAS